MTVHACTDCRNVLIDDWRNIVAVMLYQLSAPALTRCPHLGRLGTFHRNLRQYAQKSLEKRRIQVKTQVSVQGVEDVHVEGYRAPATEAILR